MAASAGTQLTGQILSNRSQNKAYQRQLAAEKAERDDALAIERERMAEERRRYDAEAQAREPYERMRMGALIALGRGMGMDLSGLMPGAGGGGMAPSGGAPRAAAPAAQAPGGGQSMEQPTMASLLRAGGGQPSAAPSFAMSPVTPGSSPINATMAQLMQAEQMQKLFGQVAR
jgi:hypothetical protein